MPDLLVLDASAALACVRNEPRGREIRGLLARHLARDGTVVVPEVFWLEVTNVLVRRHHLPLDLVLEALRDLDEFEIQTVPGDRGLLILGLDQMATHGLSAYDAAYLAIVRAEACGIVTLDERLGRAAGALSLVRWPGAVHEELASYGSPEPLDIWAAHGAYFAELRRQAEAGILR